MNKSANIKTNKLDNALAIKWRGRSGRFYPFTQEKLDNFVLSNDNLYVIAEGNEPLWIGTADDLIIDGNSRAKFRAALKVASNILRLSGEENKTERLKAAWDIEGGHLANSVNLNHSSNLPQHSSNLTHAHWL